MGVKHLRTIPETKSNEVIKSSVENLVPIPSEYEGIFDDTCDVPICKDSFTFDTLRGHSEILSDSNDDGTSSNDDAFEDIEYVEASPLDYELVSLEEVNDVNQEEKEIDLEEILQIQDIILHEKLLNINHNSIPLGIENIDYDSKGDMYVLEELLSNDSIPLPKNESSNFDHHDDPRINIEELNEDECFDPGGGEIDVSANVKDDDYFPFIFIIRIFLPYLTYPEVSPLLPFTESEDTIFDLGIST
uniref:Reverse transcriptase domain-containing protein n=1 Tax=Tanacetum cinerariifolium TaxID=118510 RepID=A0A6L2LBA7_TANCI|nr:hypothetical protein [Tanacetum cinerariifolium]